MRFYVLANLSENKVLANKKSFSAKTYKNNFEKFY